MTGLGGHGDDFVEALGGRSKGFGGGLYCLKQGTVIKYSKSKGHQKILNPKVKQQIQVCKHRIE